MSTTLVPPTATHPPDALEGSGSVPSPLIRRILTALAGFVVIGGIGLGIALVVGATAEFNVLVFALFTVLWIAFAAALAFSPRTLHDIWHYTRERPLVVQGFVWLLFLPIMIGLWIWERTWSLPVRLVLALGIGVCNVYVFFPQNL